MWKESIKCVNYLFFVSFKNLTFGNIQSVSGRQLHTFLITCSMHKSENRHQWLVKDDWWCSEWSATFCKCSVSACLANIFSFPLCIRFIIARALKIAQCLPIVTLWDCYPTFHYSQWVWGIVNIAFQLTYLTFNWRYHAFIALKLCKGIDFARILHHEQACGDSEK